MRDHGAKQTARPIYMRNNTRMNISERSSQRGIRCGTCAGACAATAGVEAGPASVMGANKCACAGTGAGLTAREGDVDSGCWDILDLRIMRLIPAESQPSGPGP